ncbi:MAG: TRAP transporter small permease [Desulfobacterales bacterium]|nr:TRAP transporter small permease [Desulfobacterales bacterium]
MKPDNERSHKTMFQKISLGAGRLLNACEVLSLVFCVGALTLLLIANFIARQFFTSIYFAEEISEFLVIFTTFVGVSYGVRRARHIRMGAFLDLMPSSVEKIFIIIISAVSAFVMFFMADASYDYLMHSLRKAHETPALKLPYWTFYVIVPLGFLMAGLQYIRTIIKNLTVKETWMSPEQQSEYEDEPHQP